MSEQSVSTFDYQPILREGGLLLRPLTEADRSPLYEAVGDPEVWKVHPRHDRWKPEVYAGYFDGLLASGGALAIVEEATGKLAGTSSFYPCPDVEGGIAIGFSVLGMVWRGNGTNRRAKTAMLRHAFQTHDACWFHVGVNNTLSQRAMEKIGGKMMYEADLEVGGRTSHYLCYRIGRDDWAV